jgi:hypothetical protein
MNGEGVRSVVRYGLSCGLSPLGCRSFFPPPHDGSCGSEISGHRAFFHLTRRGSV